MRWALRSGSKSVQRALPSAFAQYSVVSAACISPVAVVPAASRSTTPMEAETDSRCPARSKGGWSGLEHGLGELGELLGAGRVLDQQRELVAAEPGDQGRAAAGVPRLVRALGEPLGDGGEQPVADAVAEGVVDRLEAVEVQVAQPDPAGARSGRSYASASSGRRDSRSKKRVRLGSRVTGSCICRCRSRAWSSRRSLMSATDSSTRPLARSGSGDDRDLGPEVCPSGCLRRRVQRSRACRPRSTSRYACQVRASEARSTRSAATRPASGPARRRAARRARRWR